MMVAHLFIDAENIDPRMFFKAYNKLKGRYYIRKVGCYGHKIPDVYKQWSDVHTNFDFINCQNFNKTSTDVIMAFARLYRWIK